LSLQWTSPNSLGDKSDFLNNISAVNNVKLFGLRLLVSPSRRPKEPLGNEPRKRALSRNLCWMNNFESHLRFVGLISA
jgi:hypothetical protein